MRAAKTRSKNMVKKLLTIGFHCGNIILVLNDSTSPINARVVELVDSLASGASARKGVRVRLPPRAPQRDIRKDVPFALAIVAETVFFTGTGIPDREIIRLAIKSMGLDQLGEFDPQQKVIEYLIEDKNAKRLVDLTARGFAEETASESPAPGGGSISAYMGALGAALATMVANLSAHKAAYDDRWEEFSAAAERGQELMERLLHLVDEDTESFNRIMAVFAMPKKSEAEKAARAQAMEEATLYATEVPLRTMETAAEAFGVIREMAERGNPNSVTDAGVGALAARAAVRGAFLNVRINAAGLKDRTRAEALIERGAAIEADAAIQEGEILAIVNAKI